MIGDVLVLKHQAIGIHKVDEIVFVLVQCRTEILQLQGPILEVKHFEEKKHSCLRVRLPQIPLETTPLD